MEEKFQCLTQKHYDLGFWDPSNPSEKYRYVLSPDKMPLDDSLRQQLANIGKGVAAYLAGMPQLAFDAQQSTGDHTFGLVNQIMKKANDGLPSLTTTGNAIPVCKVDLMIDQNNCLQIAEVDAYNPRGIAYMVMLRDIYRDCIDTDAKLFPGLIDYLGKNLQDSVVWTYAERERYYGNVLGIASDIISRETNKEMCVVKSSNLNGEASQSQFIIPYGMTRPAEQSAREELLEQYQEHPENFFYPLMPWLGTKGLLGIVSNPTQNEKLNGLSDYFSDDISLLNDHLPETVLVGRKFLNDIKIFQENHASSVLKSHVASGMKGVWMPGNPLFEQEMQIAKRAKNSNHILQECVDQKQFNFTFFDQDGELQSRDDWYVRLIAYIGSNGEVIDAEVTARPEPDVHGALDCLQIPCVLQ